MYILHKLSANPTPNNKRRPYRFTMELTKDDVAKIRAVKERYGFQQTAGLIRYMMTAEYEKIKAKEESTHLNFNAGALLESSIRKNPMPRAERVTEYY